MVIVNKETRDTLLKIYHDSGVFLEGNIIKIIDPGTDEEFSEYLKICLDKDEEIRRKRLDITKKVQAQNKELQKAKDEIERINEELKKSLELTQKARETAEYDLDVLQKRTQYELINTIVRVALIVIIGVGLITTALYIITIFKDKDTQIIGSTWSNMFGILLTNSFSIVGTIMGVKYASEKSKK